LRAEHHDELQALELMRTGLERAEAQAFERGLAFLRATLKDHNTREERVLYPASDRLMTAAQRARFAERLQRE
jgi:hypothetical protein